MTNRLAVLTYHSIDDSGSVVSTHPEVLDRQMASLAELGYRGYPLDTVVKHRLSTGRWPEHAIAITFDDGFENNLRVAQPILAKYDFAASIYLITGHVGGESDWERPPAGLGRRTTLDWPQVAELSAAGWEIGAHTRSHRDLRKLDAPTVEREIIDSREDIQQHLGRSVTTFAYPYGCSSPVAEAVVSREFSAACTTVLRRASHHDPVHTLPRVDMFYLGDIRRLRRLAMGRLDSYLAFRRLGRRVRALLGPGS